MIGGTGLTKFRSTSGRRSKIEYTVRTRFCRNSSEPVPDEGGVKGTGRKTWSAYIAAYRPTTPNLADLHSSRMHPESPRKEPLASELNGVMREASSLSRYQVDRCCTRKSNRSEAIPSIFSIGNLLRSSMAVEASTNPLSSSNSTALLKGNDLDSRFPRDSKRSGETTSAFALFGISLLR